MHIRQSQSQEKGSECNVKKDLGEAFEKTLGNRTQINVC